MLCDVNKNIQGSIRMDDQMLETIKHYKKCWKLYIAAIVDVKTLNLFRILLRTSFLRKLPITFYEINWPCSTATFNSSLRRISELLKWLQCCKEIMKNYMWHLRGISNLGTMRKLMNLVYSWVDLWLCLNTENSERSNKALRSVLTNNY